MCRWQVAANEEPTIGLSGQLSEKETDGREGEKAVGVSRAHNHSNETGSAAR